MTKEKAFLTSWKENEARFKKLEDAFGELLFSGHHTPEDVEKLFREAEEELYQFGLSELHRLKCIDSKQLCIVIINTAIETLVRAAGLKKIKLTQTRELRPTS